MINNMYFLYVTPLSFAEFLIVMPNAIIKSFQRNLLSNGWSLLKPGGILVYSTCSLSRKQNEDVIEWFLLNHKGDARLEVIPGIENFNFAPPKVNSNNGDSSSNQDLLANVARFDPIHSNTSGFFLARIRKFKSFQQQQY